MNRNSGNVSKTKKLILGVGNNSKLNRKLFHKLSDSSSISSNRNSSAHSEEDVRVSGAYLRPQVAAAGNTSHEEQEQLMKKLQAQVKDLRHKLKVLEESVDSKDYSLGTIAREKDRAVGEIRRLERSNKQLRQQLHDERNHYLEEKEKFCEEMTKYKKKLQEVKSVSDGKKSAPIGRHSLINQSLRWQLSKEKGDFADSKTTAGSDLRNTKSQKVLGGKDRNTLQVSTLSFSDSQIRKPDSIESLHLYEGDDVSLQMTALRTENAKLRSIICERDERNYELCLRFLRMKHYKNDIKNRFQDLENEYLQVIANLMDKIDEARQEFNFIIDQKFKRPLHSTNAMYLQMVQRNSRMAFENASLRLENQCLKKEINKYMNSASEFDRKVQPQSTAEELDNKLTLEEATNDKKLKRIKKNVNFKEIRTIYERDLNFKNSDTDSNYMSKTSTTVPSNGSLGDPKSNESIIENVHTSGNKIPSNFKVNSLPDDILNKIFKRIDTSSYQSLESNRSKVQNKAVVKSKEGTPDRAALPGSSENHIHNKPPQSLEKNIPKEEPARDKSQEPIIIEHKSPPKITDSSSPCESKESVHFYAKGLPVYSDLGVEETEKEDYLPMRRQGKPDQLKTFKNRLTSQRRGPDYFDRELEEGSFSDLSLRRFTLAGRNVLGRHNKPPQSAQEGEFSQVQGRSRTKQPHDSCGLQENLEISDLELPPPAIAGSKVEAEEPAKGAEERSGDTTARVVLAESDDERLCEKGGQRLGAKVLPPAIGSRSKSSNKLSLHDELLKAKKEHQKSEDSICRTEEAFRWIRSGSSTKVQKSGQENTDKSFQCNLLDPPRIPHETSQGATERDMPQSRRPEASKRFSHRLVSTSPEQLRSILTESQLGAFQMGPIIVGHATTEIRPSFKYGDSNEIFLQLVIPQAKADTSPQIFLDNADALEKETSRSVLSPVGPAKSSNPAETCSSDIRIHVSSLPTSNSTMEMIDSAAINDRSNIMMRTLSAPGLLESNWLDPYTICEMRDCRGRVEPLERMFPTFGTENSLSQDQVSGSPSRRLAQAFPLTSGRNGSYSGHYCLQNGQSAIDWRLLPAAALSD